MLNIDAMAKMRHTFLQWGKILSYSIVEEILDNAHSRALSSRPAVDILFKVHYYQPKRSPMPTPKPCPEKLPAKFWDLREPSISNSKALRFKPRTSLCFQIVS